MRRARPGLATTGGPLIVASSPYAKRGVLWETHRKHYGKDGDPLILVAQGTSRDFNPSLPQSVIDRALERDRAAASAEYLAQFRADIETFVAYEVVQACVGDHVEMAPLTAIKTAQERAFDSVLKFKDTAAEAATALEQAKADEPRQLVESFIGGATAVVVSPVKPAAAAVEEAEARLADARQMREALSGEEKAAERELEWAKMKLDDAVREAVKADPATVRLFVVFNEAEKNYNALRQAMGVVGTGQLPEEAKFWDSIHRWPEMPAAMAWKSAIAALRADADAELPE